MTLWVGMKCQWKRSRSGRGPFTCPALLRGRHPGGEEERGVGYTLLRNSPPVGCSGVLHSEEFLALSLLLFGSLSLIMSYWRQKRAITPGGEEGSIHHQPSPVILSHTYACTCFCKQLGKITGDRNTAVLWFLTRYTFLSSPAHMISTTTMMMSSPALSWVVWPTSSIVTSSRGVKKFI